MAVKSNPFAHLISCHEACSKNSFPSSADIGFHLDTPSSSPSLLATTLRVLHHRGVIGTHVHVTRSPGPLSKTLQNDHKERKHSQSTLNRDPVTETRPEGELLSVEAKAFRLVRRLLQYKPSSWDVYRPRISCSTGVMEAATSNRSILGLARECAAVHTWGLPLSLETCFCYYLALALLSVSLK